MHGIQSIRQLIPRKTKNNPTKILIKCMEIHDYPKFKWRGLLLDCCRHFMEKDFVKKYIDLLAFHKMNVLHWHLTEDQGWRIEIDKYPKLTEIGAWRKDKNGDLYGGYYSKEDIREIVEYAKSRHIEIIPEIELPGHSIAAIASYPNLSCTGEKINVETDWGVFKDIYCAGEDSVFTFLEGVLSEVVELFPSKYIHIGGDEAPKYRWENCSKCQKRILENKLKDEHELQSYFIQRIEKFLAKKGKKIIGWDGIIEGGIPGDICDITVFKRRKKYWQAKIEKIHTYSPKRTNPKCEHFGTCGGCKWQNMKYDSQLAFKEKEVLNNLKRIGGIEIKNKSEKEEQNKSTVESH